MDVPKVSQNVRRHMGGQRAEFSEQFSKMTRTPRTEAGRNGLGVWEENGVGAERSDHRITESQNSRGWKGPLWVI